ncbi:SAM-dependent methyltransferase [Haloarchaeobius sp. DFWS5]|uniref:SAM-dependent methyltransferase n=1 Tax=Haloarchaeobius sp. DFWS5 TaxID=3446114 RepID=UPI003EBE6E11
MQFEERERIYGQPGYYWGREQNDFAERTLAAVDDDPESMKLVDIGAGEGRDAVFFAESGFDVFATDVSPTGLEKAERLAEERGVSLRTVEADANHLFVPWTVDVMYSIGALQYVRPENREAQFDHFKSQTNPGGVHALFTFVDHPKIPTPPDWTENEYFYERGELAGYYEDWDVIEAKGMVFRDESGNEPHRHAAEQLLLKKPE